MTSPSPVTRHPSPITCLFCILCLMLFPLHSTARVSESTPAQIEPSESVQHIRRIIFYGNDALNDRKLMELLGMKPGQQFNPGLMDRARQQILEEYRRIGHLFAKVEWECRPAEKDQIALHIKVSEGEVIRMGKIEFFGNTVFSEKRLMDELDIRKSPFFDDSTFKSDMERLLRLYSNKGHPLVKLSPAEFTIEDGMLNVKIDIEEGPLVRFHQVQVDGLKKTRENIPLRELAVRSGDVFDQREIDESLRRLNNMGYFQSVGAAFTPASTGDDVVLIFPVTEGRTGRFSGVLGYNPSQDEVGTQKFTGVLEAEETNLLGTGRQIAIRAKFGLIDSYEFAYREPWIFDAPVDVGIQLWGIKQEIQGIRGQGNGKAETAGRFLEERAASLSGSMRMIHTIEGSLAVTYKRIKSPPEITDVLSASTGQKYSLTFTLQRNTRDYLINPSTGRLDRASVEVSRGDFRTFKAWLDTNQYFKTRERQVLAVGLHGARVWGENIPLTEMLYLGGANTLRGYSEDFFRGEGRLFTNCEYRFLVSHDSQFFLFLDGGTVYNKGDGLDRLKLGYGVGTRLRSRTGLISVDYGLAKGDSILSGKIHVSLGATF